MSTFEKSPFLWFFVVPMAVLILCGEVAETTGRTEISKATGWGGYHANDNYGVFREGRFIQIVTNFTPARIMEHDGKIVRAQAVINHGYPLWTYIPATQAEQDLWLKYFGPKP